MCPNIIEVCINIEKSGLLASKALRAIASQRRSLDSRGQKSRGAASVVPLGSAVGRTVSPANSRADALAPGPQKATLFGEGGAEEVAREAGMSRTGAGWPLSRRDCCFVRRGLGRREHDARPGASGNRGTSGQGLGCGIQEAGASPGSSLSDPFSVLEQRLAHSRPSLNICQGGG